MTFLLSFFLLASVFSASPDGEEEEQKVFVQIMRAGEKDIRTVTWDVRELTVNGRSLWDELLAHPYEKKKPLKTGDSFDNNGHALRSHFNVRTMGVSKNNEDFIPSTAIDQALDMFTKALASGKGLTYDLSQARIDNSAADDFKADRWLWWSGPTWKFIHIFSWRVRPVRPGCVWLVLMNKGVTIEGRKAL